MASHLPEASPPGAIACRRGVRFHVDRGHGRPRAQCFPSSGCLQVQYFHQRPISTHLQRSVECLAGAATKHREGRARARGGACSGRRAGHVPCGLPRSHRGSRRAEENAIGWTNTPASSRFRHGPTQAGGRGTPPRGDPETQAPSAMLPLKQVLQGPTAESRDSPARPTAQGTSLPPVAEGSSAQSRVQAGRGDGPGRYPAVPGCSACPQNSRAAALTPSGSRCDHTWGRAFGEVTRVKRAFAGPGSGAAGIRA